MPVLYKDIQNIDSGAQFHSVDLHIHSYGASSDVRDTTMTPEAIVDSAVRQGLKVIAITDHNSDKNVARALTHSHRYRDMLLVLAAVEVTTAHGHVLVYFAPEKASELSRFIAKLDLVGEPGEANTHTAKSMADVMSEADRLGAICIAAHIDREKTGFEMLAAGYPNWKRDIITHTGLYGLECDDPAVLAWYSDTDVAGAPGSERTKLFQARASNPQTKARRHLAHVQFSDSHSMAAFQSNSAVKKWTRIKLNELSFGAFRTALVDPTARVVATASVPRSIPRVRGMALTGGFLSGEAIRFSDNLNCFIGGRGTGKSTAIRSLAYCFGIDEAFGEYDSCPDSIVVFCEDADGIVYRYERARGGEILVKVKENASVMDAPASSFRIEYFGQGELAKVAEDPLNAPHLLQAFLDRHINLEEFLSQERSMLGQLRANASHLNALENAFAVLEGKRKSLSDVDAKLAVAETGKLREIVGTQSRIAAEKAIRTMIEGVVDEYTNGLTLAAFEKDFAQITATAGAVTGDTISLKVLADMRAIIGRSNEGLARAAFGINAALRLHADALKLQCAELKANHARMEGELAPKIADLKSKGLAGNIAELDLLLKQRAALVKEIGAIEQKSNELQQYRKQRKTLLADLHATREQMSTRRKAQLASINSNLARTISDYKVFVRYDDAGIVESFLQFVLEKMSGTWVQEEAIRQLCESTTPADLAAMVLNRDIGKMLSTGSVSQSAAQKLIDKLCYWNILFELECLAKQPKPVISVLTKSAPQKTIPVAQLSDGQRHTILLTIALLAESNVPLVIDQPEDDLDNAFIFSSIVSTLRTIKERRQVILITHNANIAVLGDSELLLPMRRDEDCGRVVERGSIDRQATKRLVQNILEGGSEAFLRRQEIYGH